MGTWAGTELAGIPVIGVNSKDTNNAEYNALMTHDSHIPWLQDTSASPLWDAAVAAKDDIYILDGQHKIVSYFSCYDFDLAVGAGRDTLRARLRRIPGVSMLSQGDPPARRGIGMATAAR